MFKLKTKTDTLLLKSNSYKCMKIHQKLKRLFKQKRIVELLINQKILILLLACVFLIHTAGYTQPGYAISMQNRSIREVLKKIEGFGTYRFFFKDDLVSLEKKVNLNVEKADLDEILKKVFANTDLGYKIMEDNLVIVTQSSALLPKGAISKQLNIRGIIIDENGLPLPGVNIRVKSTGLGTVSDKEGRFSIDIADRNTLLQFSFIGFITQDIEVGSQSFVTVVLKEDIKKLDEVVVIGYGQIRKKDLSTAVSTLSNLSSMKSRPTGIGGMMQGNIAGVTVVNNGGDPGSSPQIVIRGNGSRGGDSPLWVVDGVPGAPVNTEDIESLVVLKDAASAAIYGSNVGSGGVILVTTKQAKSGKPRIEANFYRGYENAWKLPSALNAKELADVKNLAADNAGVARNPAFDATQNPYGMVTRTNWIDEIFRTGKTDHFSITATGGNDNLKGLVSFEANNTDGVLLNTFSRGFSGKAIVDFKISKNISFSQWIQAGVTKGYSADTHSGYTGTIISAIYMPPSATVYDKDGSFGGVVPKDNLKYAGAYGDIVNPVATLLRTDISNPTRKIHSTSTLSVNLIPGLSFKSVFTISGNDSQYSSFSPIRSEPGKPSLSNSLDLSTSSYYRWLWENVGTYTKTFDKHVFTLMGGYTSSYEKYTGFGLTAYDFLYEDAWARTLINASDWSKSKPYQNISEQAATSSFGRISYNYSDRYFLTASLRNDATSKLYTKNNSGTFPAVSGAWKISSEPFFDVPLINLLKIRGSWGQIGNVGKVPNYSSNVTLTSQRNTILGQNPVQNTGLALTSIANYDLTWETSEQTDFGFDLDLFNNHLNIVSDYYEKKTKNLIDYIPIAGTAGIPNQPLGNVGLVKNSGIEVAVTYSNQIGDLKYKIGGNFATNKSEVLNLGTSAYYNEGDAVRGVLTPLRSTVGQPWYSYFVIPTNGIFQSDAEAKAYLNKSGTPIQPNAKAGDLKFVDSNGDGQINDNDRVYKGSYLPKTTFGFNGYASYKGFDFSFQIQGVSGNKIFNALKLTTLTAAEQGYNMSRDILGAWSPTNKGSNIPRVSATDPNQNFGLTSDWYLEDGSYLRVKNITMGYSIPSSFFQKVKMENCKVRFYLSAENLLTITKYSGMDPEVGNNGIDVGSYPVSRTFSVGVNVNF